MTPSAKSDDRVAKKWHKMWKVITGWPKSDTKCEKWWQGGQKVTPNAKSDYRLAKKWHQVRKVMTGWPKSDTKCEKWLQAGQKVTPSVKSDDRVAKKWHQMRKVITGWPKKSDNKCESDVDRVAKSLSVPSFHSIFPHITLNKCITCLPLWNWSTDKVY